MNSVVAWVSMLCFASVACTIMRMIAPEGSLGRVFKTITVAFFICAFCVPLLSAKKLLDFEAVNVNVNGIHSSEQNATKLQEELDMQFLIQVNNTVTQVSREVLSASGVEVVKAETHMSVEEKDKKNVKNIDAITVYIDKKSQSKTIEVNRILEETFGVKVTVRTANITS